MAVSSLTAVVEAEGILQQDRPHQAWVLAWQTLLEVVSLNKPTDSAMRDAKADLKKNVRVVSVFDFNRSWTEEEVFSRIPQVFQEKLGGCR
jgi:hypothetical protein